MWYGPVAYTNSKVTLPNQSFSEKRFGWPEQIRTDLALVFEVNLNCYIINKYRDGSDKVAWHADNEQIFIK